MVRELEIKLLPGELKDAALLRSKAARLCQVAEDEIQSVQVVKRSLDARSRTPFYLLRVRVYIQETPNPEPLISTNYREVHEAPPVLIVGAGPTGYFAALEFLELGLKPIVLDRGKDVRTRRKDLRAIQQFGEVHPHSNYCFGEGGAGTYSDGKLYTRSHKRGDIQKSLRILVEHGAHSDILVEAHPHIGSNKLPGVVSNIRETILHYGGEVHFDSCVTDFIMEGPRVLGVVVNDKVTYQAEATVLATGHSARDIYHLLLKKQIAIEAKPFALGVRIEHPQPLIDKIQYHQEKRDPDLPASSYKLACQVDGRGVFSFCMCPGGLVVPAATSPGELVVNGMSMSRRDSPYANSGTVVAVELEDLGNWKEHGPLTAMAFQQSVEQTLWQHGDGSQKAPALRLTDFVQGKLSQTLPGTSYIPGIYPAPLYELLPSFIAHKLQAAVRQFGQQMRGYYTEKAVVIGTESRTSAPVRIPRDPVTCMHPHVVGLFPGGEGAGYAGGILSAAMDGQRVAQAVAQLYSTWV